MIKNSSLFVFLKQKQAQLIRTHMYNTHKTFPLNCLYLEVQDLRFDYDLIRLMYVI